MPAIWLPTLVDSFISCAIISNPVEGSQSPGWLPSIP